MEHQKLTLEEIRKIKGMDKYSDKALLEIRDTLNQLANICYEAYLDQQKKSQSNDQDPSDKINQ